jgi:hypothetical protein
MADNPSDLPEAPAQPENESPNIPANDERPADQFASIDGDGNILAPGEHDEDANL